MEIGEAKVVASIPIRTRGDPKETLDHNTSGIRPSKNPFLHLFDDQPREDTQRHSQGTICNASSSSFEAKSKCRQK